MGAEGPDVEPGWELERGRRERAALDRRRAAAWRLARTLAVAGASRAIRFGSRNDPQRFGRHSDIDLIVFGLTPRASWDQSGRALQAELPVDMLYAPQARPEILGGARREGVVLHGGA